MTDTVSQALRAGAGLLTLVVPALAAPPRGLILTGAGVLLVVASVLGRFGPWAGTLAAVVPVVQCAIWPPGTALLAAEGLLILGYLLLLDGLTRLRAQLRFGVAGLISAGAGAGRAGGAGGHVSVARAGRPGRRRRRVRDRRAHPSHG